MLLGIDVKGSIEGTLWLMTHLVYDQVLRRATIQLLDYEVRTSNVLVWAASWLYPALLDRLVTGVFSEYSYDVGSDLDAMRAKVDAALNQPLGADVALETELHDGILVTGPFTEGQSFGFAAELRGHSRLIVRRSGDPIPTGREIRYVSVFFETIGQDKDAEEPVDVTLEIKDAPPITRSLGITERWGDDENQGPFVFRVPLSKAIVNCADLGLRVRKEPSGSPTGKSWIMRMTATLIRADGSTVVGAVSPRSQWGDGEDNPFDRHFGLCQGPQAAVATP